MVGLEFRPQFTFPYSKVIALSSLGTPILLECQMSHVGLCISTVGVQLVVICLVGGTLLESMRAWVGSTS